jgi:hypothetical protein
MKIGAIHLGYFILPGMGLAALIPILVSAIAVPHAPRDHRHCVIGQAPANTFVPVFDETDPLVALAPRQVRYDLARDIAKLGDGDRVVVIDAHGDASSELQPALDVCLPGNENNIARMAMQRDVWVPLLHHLDVIAAVPPVKETSLAELVARIASDRSLRVQGTRLIIALFTDALQNSRLQSAYRPGSRFPPVDPHLLQGVTVEIHLLRNPRDEALQPRASARLVAWLKAAGAEVRYAAPAWLLLAGSLSHRHPHKRSHAS